MLYHEVSRSHASLHRRILVCLYATAPSGRAYGLFSWEVKAAVKGIREIAIEAALSNTIQKLPRMGAALITLEGDIFVGRNQLKTHPLQASFGNRFGKPKSIFLHAEIDCLIKAMRVYPAGANTLRAIWVARVSKTNYVRLAKPCNVCMKALLHFGVKDIQWTI